MAEITPALIKSIFFNLNTVFQGAIQATEIWWKKIAMEVPSTTKENRYAWLDRIPRMRKWVGDRYKHNVSARAYSLVNDDYELTETLDRNDIEDDNLGVFTPLIASMGEQSAKWPDDMLLAVMQGAAATVGYDGVAFFSTSHPVDLDDSSKGTYGNLHTPGFGLGSQNLNTVMAEMRVRHGADGKPIRVKPRYLVVGPQLEVAAKQILNTTFTAPAVATGQNAASAQQENVLKGMLEPIVIEDLEAEPLVWYVLGEAAGLRPFVVQIRKAPVFTSYTNPADESVFWKKEFVYGLDARGAAGVSLPFLATRCEG